MCKIRVTKHTLEDIIILIDYSQRYKQNSFIPAKFRPCLSRRSTGKSREQSLPSHALLFAGHLKQPEMRPAQNMCLRAVAADYALQPLLDLTAVLIKLHINKINNNNATRITQPDQPANLLRREQIRLRHCLLQCRSACVLGCVHIDHGQRFGLIPD